MTIKAWKQTVRHYYKYVYEPWTQPVLTSNGTLGGDSFAVYCARNLAQYPAYYAFDSNASTFCVTHGYDYIFYNPISLKITYITHTTAPGKYFRGGAFYGSNDNVTWELISNLASSTTWDLSSNTNAYTYFKITQTPGLDADWQPANFVITATEQTIQESTSSDYDFYEDVAEYKGVKKVVRTYYKYVYEPWTQPVLTSNNDKGIISSASGTDNPAYYLFANSSNCNASTGVGFFYLHYTFPYPLSISNFSFGTYVSPSSQADARFDFYTDTSKTNLMATVTTRSNGISLDVNDVITSELYIEITRVSSGNWFGIHSFQMTAEQGVAQETTSSDYDFYEDVETYYGFNL